MASQKRVAKAVRPKSAGMTKSKSSYAFGSRAPRDCMISYDIKKYFKPGQDNVDGKRRSSVANGVNQDCESAQYRTEINVDNVDQANSRRPMNNYATINLC